MKNKTVTFFKTYNSWHLAVVEFVQNQINLGFIPTYTKFHKLSRVEILYL